MELQRDYDEQRHPSGMARDLLDALSRCETLGSAMVFTRDEVVGALADSDREWLAGQHLAALYKMLGITGPEIQIIAERRRAAATRRISARSTIRCGGDEEGADGEDWDEYGSFAAKVRGSRRGRGK